MSVKISASTLKNDEKNVGRALLVAGRAYHEDGAARYQ